tara:strand:- start:315 stop:491 length:177 start_codon:yes stop_codon:yes gene_type:complete
MRVNPSNPANQRIQKTNDLPASKKPSIELLTDNSKLSRNECRPGECAPINGGKCYPDH